MADLIESGARARRKPAPATGGLRPGGNRVAGHRSGTSWRERGRITLSRQRASSASSCPRPGARGGGQRTGVVVQDAGAMSAVIDADQPEHPQATGGRPVELTTAIRSPAPHPRSFSCRGSTGLCPPCLLVSSTLQRGERLTSPTRELCGPCRNAGRHRTGAVRPPQPLVPSRPRLLRASRAPMRSACAPLPSWPTAGPLRVASAQEKTPGQTVLTWGPGVGRVGLEPTTNGLKVHCSAN